MHHTVWAAVQLDLETNQEMALHDPLVEAVASPYTQLHARCSVGGVCFRTDDIFFNFLTLTFKHCIPITSSRETSSLLMAVNEADLKPVTAQKIATSNNRPVGSRSWRAGQPKGSAFLGSDSTAHMRVLLFNKS